MSTQVTAENAMSRDGEPVTIVNPNTGRVVCTGELANKEPTVAANDGHTEIWIWTMLGDRRILSSYTSDWFREGVASA